MEVKNCIYRLTKKHENNMYQREAQTKIPSPKAVGQSCLVHLHQASVIQPHILTVKQLLGPSAWGSRAVMDVE
jgi:hypothetical protein